MTYTYEIKEESVKNNQTYLLLEILKDGVFLREDSISIQGGIVNAEQKDLLIQEYITNNYG